MKKIFSILLCGIMILGLVGCVNKKAEELTLSELEQYIKEEFKNENSSIEEIETAWNEVKMVVNEFGEMTASSEEQEFNDILKHAKEVEELINDVNLKNIKNKTVREYCEEYMGLAKKSVACVKGACRSIIDGKSEDETTKYFELAFDIYEYTESRENAYNQYLELSPDMTISELRSQNNKENDLEEINKSYNDIMGTSD